MHAAYQPGQLPVGEHAFHWNPATQISEIFSRTLNCGTNRADPAYLMSTNEWQPIASAKKHGKTYGLCGLGTSYRARWEKIAMSLQIRAQRLGADSKFTTGLGTIEASDLAGPSVLHAGSGNIRASYLAPGKVIANTGHGSVSLGTVQGELKVETGSGDLEIEGKPTAPWKLETGFGSINVNLRSSGFALDAETGWGTVTFNLPITPTKINGQAPRSSEK